MIRRALLVVGLLSLLAMPARAVSHTVQLTASGPVPAHLAMRPGDTVVFVNVDTEPHRVTSQGSWQFDSGPLPPGQTSGPTPALTAPGTYTYDDDRGIVLLPQHFKGALVVQRTSPVPKPTPRPSSPPGTQPPPATAPPTLTPTAAPTASPVPSATARATPSPSHRGTPAPTSAGTPPTGGGTTPVQYGAASALVQGSPHRYGLPALIGLVSIGGVASLIGRYLLSLPEGRRQQTGP